MSLVMSVSPDTFLPLSIRIPFKTSSFNLEIIIVIVYKYDRVKYFCIVRSVFHRRRLSDTMQLLKTVFIYHMTDLPPYFLLT